jgi:hypothetical protein
MRPAARGTPRVDYATRTTDVRSVPWTEVHGYHCIHRTAMQKFGSLPWAELTWLEEIHRLVANAPCRQPHHSAPYGRQAYVAAGK